MGLGLGAVLSSILLGPPASGEARDPQLVPLGLDVLLSPEPPASGSARVAGGLDGRLAGWLDVWVAR